MVKRPASAAGYFTGTCGLLSSTANKQELEIMYRREVIVMALSNTRGANVLLYRIYIALIE